MADDGVAVVRRFLGAFGPSGPDMDVVDDVFHDDITWHWSGHSDLAGTYSGKPEVYGFFEEVGRRLMADGVEHRLEPHDVVGGEEHTVAIWTRLGRRNGVDLNTGGVGVYHVRDGKIHDVWVIHEDQQAADAFFA